MSNRSDSWVNGNVTLLRGDCLQALSPADLAAVDAVIGDPPYGMGYVSHHNTRTTGGEWARKAGNFAPITGDDRPFDPRPWLGFPHVVLWGAQHYAERLPSYRGWLVWDKLAGKTPCSQSDCELAWTNQDRPVRMFTHLWRGMIRAGRENVVNGGKLHPNQKPVALMRWCIETVGVPAGAVILDPYMGSGSTGVAAVELGYPFVGIEIDEGYFDIARERIAATQSQYVQSVFSQVT